MEAGPTLEEPELLSLPDNGDGDQEVRDRSSGLPSKAEMVKNARTLEIQEVRCAPRRGTQATGVGVDTR